MIGYRGFKPRQYLMFVPLYIYFDKTYPGPYLVLYIGVTVYKSDFLLLVGMSFQLALRSKS